MGSAAAGRSAPSSSATAAGNPLLADDVLDEGDKQRFEQAGVDVRRPTHRHLLTLVKEIQDFPRHLSIHPGGFLLGHARLDEMVPVAPASMEDRINLHQLMELKAAFDRADTAVMLSAAAVGDIVS